MRRRDDQHALQTIHSRAPASELYWAVIASMVDDGTVNANVMRRDAPDPRTLELVKKGTAVEMRPILVGQAQSRTAVDQQRERVQAWRASISAHGRRAHRASNDSNAGHTAASVVPWTGQCGVPSLCGLASPGCYCEHCEAPAEACKNGTHQNHYLLGHCEWARPHLQECDTR